MIDQLYATKTDAFEAGKGVGRAMILTPEERARAAQAVLDYFKSHPEAGDTPLFHHRVGIANAILDGLSIRISMRTAEVVGQMVGNE